jgi:hypothetical protein
MLPASISHGTVSTFKINPATDPASALTVPVIAISNPLRRGLLTICCQDKIMQSYPSV